MKYFFIGGAPKSGTTWIQRTLDLHPQIVCSGEGHVHELIAKPMAAMIGDYNTKLRAVNTAVYEGRPYHAEIGRAELIELTRDVIGKILARRAGHNTVLVGDKTPHYAKVIGDLNVLFPGMRFVMMVRDPRDVVASRLGHAIRRVGGEYADPGSPAYVEIVQAAVRDWAEGYSITRGYAAKHPEQIMFIRYENLLARPHDEVRRLIGFLEAPISEKILEEMIAGSSFEVLSGGRTRGVEDAGSFYRKGIAGDWPNHLTPEALQMVQDGCAGAMEQMGYVRA